MPDNSLNRKYEPYDRIWGWAGGAGGSRPTTKPAMRSEIDEPQSESDEPQSEIDKLRETAPRAETSQHVGLSRVEDIDETIPELQDDFDRESRSLYDTDETIQELNMEDQPQEQEECAKDHMHQEDQVSTAEDTELVEEREQLQLVFRGWLKPCVQVVGLLVWIWLMYTLSEYIPIELSMVMLIYIWSFWMPIRRIHELKVIWKYNFWQFLGMIFKSNNSKLLKFADFVRKTFPHLAPCYALQNDVSWSAIASKYVARTNGGKLQGLPNLCGNPIVALNHPFEETFFSKTIQIGAGFVHVKRLTEDQFHFKCEARGEDFLEDFVAITDWKSIDTILSILEFWKASPEVGVIENLIHREEGIYCHALSMKEIVEGVDKSLDYFSIFQLQEAKRFFIGCGGDESVSHYKANGSTEPHMTTPTIVAVMVAVGAYYQLRDNYNVVAIVSLVGPSGLAMLIFVADFFGHLFKKGFFYWVFTALCLGSANRRLGVYLRLSKRDSTLAYCNEFRPDQLRVVDTKKEAIFLFKSQYITSANMWATLEKPDWASLHIDINAVGTSDVWHNRRIGNNDFNFKLYTDPNNEAIVFEMVYPYSNCMLKCKRTILARSIRKRSRRGGLKGTMTTQVSLDGQAETYQWPVGSFHLFVYLMLKWRGLSDGVIENWEHFMLRTYYHVFSTHALAAHIEKHKLVSYYLLPDHPQPTTP